MFGSADAVSCRRVHDYDAAASGRRDVDVIHPGSRAPDDLELRGAFEQLGRDLGTAANHQDFSLGEGLLNLAGVLVVEFLHVEAWLSFGAGRARPALFLPGSGSLS